MKPLINSQGHLRVLEEYVKFLPNGPKEQISWTLGQGWNLFLAGHAVMEPTWGDLPTLAQDPKSNKQTLEMQSEYTSATRDPLEDACSARGSWMTFFAGWI